MYSKSLSWVLVHSVIFLSCCPQSLFILLAVCVVICTYTLQTSKHTVGKSCFIVHVETQDIFITFCVCFHCFGLRLKINSPPTNRRRPNESVAIGRCSVSWPLELYGAPKFTQKCFVIVYLPLQVKQL